MRLLEQGPNVSSLLGSAGVGCRPSTGASESRCTQLPPAGIAAQSVFMPALLRPHRRTATEGVCEGCQAAMSSGIRQRGHPRPGPGASVWEWLRLGIGQHRQCQQGSPPETASLLDVLLSMRSTGADSTVARASFRLSGLAGDQIGCCRVLVTQERSRCWSASPCCFPAGPRWR